MDKLLNNELHLGTLMSRIIVHVRLFFLEKKFPLYGPIKDLYVFEKNFTIFSPEYQQK